VTVLDFRPYTRARLLERLNSTDGALSVIVADAGPSLWPTLADLDAQAREDLALGVPVRELTREEWQADALVYRRRLESVVWHHWPGCPAWPQDGYRETRAWWGEGRACRVCVAARRPSWWPTWAE
jgi:hypothetical protein